MKPTKNDTHAIVEFIDVLLREGAIIQADVIITVADIPLIGVSLRAAIAGMTTMTEYGIFEEWDAAHRTRTER
ncbi:gas vesicle protein GvpM [Haloquadratum walsbyi]|jgi:Gas vesicle protein.|uniref:Gas vesicle protein n=1 Tax=Haloquadratum walsbyi J07HQW2 TaxID=1238425 RepID=U1NI23_9EURY|nr:gas vesicle protein GvpJ [Haloquadratum walsbyi]ERG96830.1 MAG: gas vesicle protein [Haloquadratum walsbyi J07HQW2]